MRPTEEQEELRSAVRQLLARQPGPDAWGPLAGQIGAAGLAVPEEHGGAGCGPLEVHVVMEELGRALAPVPFLGSAVLTTQALLACGDAALLPALAEGRAVGALAWAEDGSWEPAAIRTAAHRGPDGGWRLTGTKDHVLDGADATLLVVAARTAAGVALFEVPVDGPGVRRERLVPMDPTRAQARIALDGAAGRLLGADGDGERVLARVRDLGSVALAAEQVGAAERCLELTVAYARERVQFGRPIGSFQAVKHLCAGMLVRAELARAAVYAAAVTGDALDVAGAKLLADEAAVHNARDCLQVHGGMGFTWEADVHLHLKRAWLRAAAWGGAQDATERWADALVE